LRQIVIAAAAASVIGGWAAPAAYAEGGATDAAPKPVSKAANAVKSTVDSMRKTLTDASSSLQKAAGSALQTGAGGAGTSTSLFSKPKSTVSSSGGFIQANQPVDNEQPNALTGPTPPSNDDATGSVTIPVVNVTLPGLPTGQGSLCPPRVPGFRPASAPRAPMTALRSHLVPGH
jgi:hypothetical protein